MPIEDSTPGDELLVIGYGNTLRSDDGAGVLVAGLVASWDRPGVRSMAVHQLTPELAGSLAGTRRVVFVDARLAAVGADLSIATVEPATSPPGAGHNSDPRSLLVLARWLYGRSAEAWLLTVPGVDFSIGERISATAARGMERALVRIAAMAGES